MEPQFVCTYTYTVGKHVERIWKAHLIRFLVMILLGVVYLVYVVRYINRWGWRPIWVFFFLFALVFLVYTILTPRINAFLSVRKMEQRLGKPAVIYIAFGDYIEVFSGPTRTAIDYRALTRVIHYRRSYVLRTGRIEGIPLDTYAFTKGSFEEFKRFLRTKRPDLVIPE